MSFVVFFAGMLIVAPHACRDRVLERVWAGMFENMLNLCEHGVVRDVALVFLVPGCTVAFADKLAVCHSR